MAPAHSTVALVETGCEGEDDPWNLPELQDGAAAWSGKEEEEEEEEVLPKLQEEGVRECSGKGQGQVKDQRLYGPF